MPTRIEVFFFSFGRLKQHLYSEQGTAESWEISHDISENNNNKEVCRRERELKKQNHFFDVMPMRYEHVYCLGMITQSISSDFFTCMFLND